MGYFKETAKGISWVGGFRVFTRAISFVRTIFLARILNPTQFGIYAIATLVLAFLEIITETGINVFLIQEDKVNKYINTAFIVSILRGGLISIFILATSGIVANFFNSPESQPLLMLVSLVPIIRGFINPSIAKFQKDLEFGRDFVVRSTVFVVDSFVSVVATLILNSPMGIIWGLVLGSLTEVVLTWIMASPTPKLEFDSKKFIKVVSRGKWVTVSGVFDYLSGHIDDTLVGKLIGTSSLGVYQMAYKLSTLPMTEVTQVFSKVTFPVYSKIASDTKRLKRAYFKTLMAISALSLPIGIILFFSADWLVPLLLGEKWIEAASILKVLSVFGAIRSVTGTTFSVYYAQKKQGFVASLLFIEFVTLSLLLFPFIKIFGLHGAGYATIIAVLIPTPLNLFYLSLSFREAKK